jgi:amino acid adenylation domain-containing protein/non-ribosomal peptide synthase protein (TIGR01720 family)
MLPSAIVVLESLPLNPSGKVDRKALPKPEYVDAGKYEAPQGEVEQMLAGIWSEVLGIGQVGRNDNFFEVGGDSILSLQIVTRTRRAGWKVTPRQLFERQTIAALAVVAAPVEGAQGAIPKNTEMIQAGMNGVIPLLPIQHEFFDQEISSRHHWNQAVLLKSSQLLDIPALAQALDALIRHHDALRFRYLKQPGKGWQQMCGELPDECGRNSRDLLWVRDAASAEEFITLCNEVQRSLDLAQGPLLRALIVKMPDGQQRLLLVAHHLVIDGVSWRVLLEDLQSAYDKYHAGEPVALPEKTTNYQTWAYRLQGYASEYPDELAYWQNLCDTPVSLPGDRPQVSADASLASITLRLGQAQTQALLRRAPAAYRTQVNDLLLTALGSALCRWSGHEKILIDLEGHGREDLYPDIDLSCTVGWFTTLYPVVLDPSGNLDQRLKRIKESLRHVPNKGLGYGWFKYYGTPEQRRALAGLPKAEVVFNYLGQFDASFDEVALWTLATDPVGDLMDTGARPSHDISINGHVHDGRLSLEVGYSTGRYAKATVEAFVKIYQVELETLIAHCTSGICGVTPSDFPLAGITQQELDRLPIPLAQLEDLYPLSPMQTGMLFHAVLDMNSGVYLNQLRADIEGLDVARFKSAWQKALERHEVLRTGFVVQDGKPLQWVAKSVGLPFREYDWSHQVKYNREDQERELDELAQSEHASGFDLAKPPLMRLTLVRLAEDRYHLIWTVHHLLLDGWSIAQLMGEVVRQHGGNALPAQESGSRLRYRSFIEWFLGRDTKASEAYWRERLDGIEATRLAGLVSVLSDDSSHGKHISELKPALTERLIQFARRERITLNTLIQAVWAILLNRYTGKQIVVFGATVAGRPGDLAGAERSLGLFINTLPVVVMLKPEQEIGDWLRDLQAQNLASREHEHTPLYEIQRWLGQSGQGLFDTILVFENYPIDEALQQSAHGELAFSEVRSREATNYPITVSVMQSDTLYLEYIYARNHFSADRVSSIATHVIKLLGEIADGLAGSAKRLCDIDILSEVERSQLKAWGVNGQRYGDTEPVHRLIERQVEARPEGIALIFGDTELSYGELNRRANRLAHRLIRLGVEPETRVGIAVERSIDMVVGLLAVLKSGGAYVPLDPEYPQERLAHMAGDSAIELLLTQSHIQSRIPHPSRCQVLELDVLDLEDEPEGNPQVCLHGENLAYVIYTSGSTGKPKGVGVAHGPLAMHVRAIGEAYGMGPADRELQFASINFDGAHERSLVPLAFGSALMPRDNELWPVDRTAAEIARHGITIACFMPSYLHQLAELMGTAGRNLPIRFYIVGGEATSRASFEFIQETLRPPRIINGYGPTETVVTPLILKTYPETRFESAYMPIGSPVGDRTAYILDANLNPVPQGVAGELYIGGIGLARGYLNRGGLTAERFIADPFDEQGGRLYRTGDLARWRADGQIEYLGRLDHQVKIRGFRIELGEIETQLLAQPEVREAVVVAREGSSASNPTGGARLIAYVSFHAGAEVEVAQLREALARVLPDYMLPSAIVVLESLPLNPSGKVDRKALPEPGKTGAEAHVPPSTQEARLVAEIWREVLGIERVGETDNFFALGGDSLSCLKVMSRMRALGNDRFDFKLRDLMQRPTIAALLGLETPGQDEAQAPLALNLPSERSCPRPLFCIHGGLGTVFDYQPLARRLQGKWMVYGFPCRMLTDPTHHDTSLEQMAADYCRMIRRVQPEGPYHLLGWSLGGTLAAIIAAFLEADAQAVAFLGLIDSFVPGDVEPGNDDWRLDFADFVSVVIPGLKPEDIMDAVSADNVESEQAIAALLEGLISAEQMRKREGGGCAEPQGYADMGAEQLARMFIVGRQLKFLSLRTPALSPLQTQATCWWIAARPLSDRRALALQIDQDERRSIELDADHFAVMRDKALLLGVESALEDFLLAPMEAEIVL